MSQFIRAIEIDRTPIQVMENWSSELSAEANRASTMALTREKMRLEQDAALSKQYGDFYNMSAEQLKGVAAEQANALMEEFKKGLAENYKNSGGDVNVFRKMGYDGAVSNLINKVNQVKGIAEFSKTAAEQMAPKGVRPEAVKSFAASYSLKPKPGQDYSQEGFAKALDEDMKLRPEAYYDKNALLGIISKRADEKGIEYNVDISNDPTGRLTIGSGVKASIKPWEDKGDYKLPNGTSVKVPKISFVKEKGFGSDANQYSVVSDETYQRFVGGNPDLETAINVAAIELAHQANAKFGIPTAGRPKEDIAVLVQEKLTPINPYDEGVMKVYRKLAATNILKNNYDEDGFSKGVDLKSVLKRDNPQKTTVNVGGGTGGGNNVEPTVIKAYEGLVSTVQSKGYAMSGDLNSTQQAIVTDALIRGGYKDYSEEPKSYYLHTGSDGRVGVYLKSKPTKNKNGSEVYKYDPSKDERLTTLDQVGVDVRVNTPLGAKSKAAAAGGASKPAPQKKQIKKSDIPAKAKAAGYTVSEYEQKLREAGVQII